MADSLVAADMPAADAIGSMSNDRRIFLDHRPLPLMVKGKSGRGFTGFFLVIDLESAFIGRYFLSMGGPSFRFLTKNGNWGIETGSPQK